MCALVLLKLCYMSTVLSFSDLFVDRHAAVAGGSLKDVLRLPGRQGAVVAQQLGVDTVVH